ncbi:zinc ABC transporter substrate-binding protein [Paenibacillus sp. MWE-103]|uniref:Zinc ABC transporter substrate-binding protein n=1 Tax=Paenibacillus artemisiicola TaxID=1172618 RepID=A0ABS3WBM8_9BACL|nr:zinc ABC transporter substrate-binding protein [Paenibacillus artemisiicola]MBO7745717.1 zinc ABC transporter substrate-binding protein [Paenibacillus artemisiicola]
MNKRLIHKQAMKRGAAAALLGSLLVLASGCGAGGDNANGSGNATNSSNAAGGNGATGGGAADAGKIRIVAAENFYGEVAEAVGGAYVDVTSLLTSPDADPHDYEPTPDASKAVDEASVVIFNGIGYDEWAQKLIDASGKAADKTVIRVASDVMARKDGDNEHVWYNPDTMGKYADYLADRLGRLDPDHKTDYANQASDYKQSLAPLTEAVASLKQAEPLPVAVSEPVFDYMAQALNLRITDDKFKMAAEEETDPAPQDIARLQDEIKGKEIAFFVNNVQATSPTVQNLVDLAGQSGVPVVEVTETLPAGKDYVAWMTDILSQVQAALD